MPSDQHHHEIKISRKNHALTMKIMIAPNYSWSIKQKSIRNKVNLKMYFILLRSFETKSNVFNDLIDILPKFKQLGINTLWVSPTQPQTPVGPPMFALNDHGYWPSHHGKIDLALGGEIAFEQLVRAARNYGIEIAIDAVINHFGYANEIELNGKKISTLDPNYFVVIHDIQSTYVRHRELNHLMENTWNVNELLRYREELSQYPLFDLPTLRKDVDEIRAYLLESYKKFVDFGVTVFRIDAAKHMPAEFLTYFANELNDYSLEHLNRPIKFIWEVYIVNSLALSTFIEGTLCKLKDSQHSFFYDFPMRYEFKRIQESDYRFEWLVNFVQHRIDTQQYLDHLIPFVEDHDDGTPIVNAPIARIIYALTEFFSRNSTLIYHGSEQAGVRIVNRPCINTINENGDLAFIVDRLGSRLLPYRICKETQIIFHRAEHDLLVSENRIATKRSMFIAVNKSCLSKTIELDYASSRYVEEILLTSTNSTIHFDKLSKHIKIELAAQSFLAFEIIL